jgi:hypothetical protein
LTKNYSRIMQGIGWKHYKGKPPKIIPVFLTDTSFLWTRFPPRGLTVVFVEVALLSDFIGNFAKR